jgi:hypothetical protein
MSKDRPEKKAYDRTPIGIVQYPDQANVIKSSAGIFGD